MGSKGSLDLYLEVAGEEFLFLMPLGEALEYEIWIHQCQRR